MGMVTRYSPNVWEHHSRALYINVPISAELAARLVAPASGLKVDLYGGSAWLSVMLDDLDSLRAHVAAGLFVPTPLCGWMSKVNLLVRRTIPGPESISVPGYQILSLRFEPGLRGAVMIAGARHTQRIPTFAAAFEMSDGPSGSARSSSTLAPGAAYSAKLLSVGDDAATAGEVLLSIEGRLSGPLEGFDRAFVKFVVGRPHKFLAQDGGAVAAYAPEDDGSGRASFSPDGVQAVDVSELQLERLLRPLFGADDLASQLDLTRAIVFIQPDYVLVDHHNVRLA
jgi:hypothetical protein